jgi:Ni/Co efflux regulator RcnB
MDSMKKTLLAVAAAILAATAATGTPVMAQGWQAGPDDRPPGHQYPQPPRGDEHGPRYEHPGYQPVHPPGPPSGYGWRAGERLPQEWRAPRYVIARPAAYHLHRPPRGHRWVRVGHDAVLVVSTTGIIVEIIPGLFR